MMLVRICWARWILETTDRAPALLTFFTKMVIWKVAEVVFRSEQINTTHKLVERYS